MRLFVRSIEVATDARLKRYAQALERRSHAYQVLFWQRQPAVEESPNSRYMAFRYAAPTGARWGNLAGLVAWNWHIARTIWRLRYTLDSIHAVDLDSALTALCCGKLLKLPVIVDFYDSYPDSRGLRGAAAAMARNLEGWMAARADLAIIADPGRLTQHGIRSEANLLVVENVPATEWAADEIDDEMPLTLGYLGNLEARHRGIEDFLGIVAGDPRLRLVIAGAGALEHQVRAAAEACGRIEFHGPVEHSTGMALMSRCHVILGLYYLSAENHRFAAPNKYYEHLLLGRPLLTSRGTPPGAKVEEHRTGWAVEDGAEPLKRLLDALTGDRPEVRAAGARARELWEERYSSYVVEQIDGQYVSKTAAIERSSN